MGSALEPANATNSMLCAITKEGKGNESETQDTTNQAQAEMIGGMGDNPLRLVLPIKESSFQM